MLKKLTVIVSIILCYAGLFLFFLTLDRATGVNQPKADHGFIDLSGWNFEKDGNVQLNGEWTFYRDQLLTPAAIHAGKGENPTNSRVPNNRYGLNGKNETSINTGTYRLTIHTDRHDQIFGMRAESVRMSSRIYLNGQLVGESGRPARGIDFEAKDSPTVSYFPLHRGDNELVVQFASPDNSINSWGWGIAKPIVLGPQKVIAHTVNLGIINDTVTIAAFFIVGLYFIGHYLQRRQDVHLLYFSLMCILFATIISCIGNETVIYLLFPDLPYSVFKLLLYSGILAVLVTLLYLYFAFRSLVSKKVVFSLMALVGLVFFVRFVPSGMARGLAAILFSVATIGTVTYTTYIFALAAARKVEGGVYLVAAAAAMSVYVVMTTIGAYSSNSLFSLYSLTSIVALMALALLMSHRFVNAFHKVETLSQELLKVDRLKDAFIARTSHEFRTPLNGIINITRTMLKRDAGHEPVDSEAIEKIRMIRHMCNRLSELVNDILDLEKIKQGVLTIRPKPVDLRSLVGLEVEFYRFMAEEKGLKIENRVSSDLPPLLADGNRLRQIVNNLLDNAIKYTYKGQVTISARELDRQVEITVADTGTGIPEDARRTIFEAYEQADVNTSEGSGLGLSIVKQLVELQNGRIWLTSQTGKGTAFHFTLPVADRPQATQTGQDDPEDATPAVPRDHASAEDSDGQSSAGRGASGSLETAAARAPKLSFARPYRSRKAGLATVLIVDDDVDNLKILIDMLEETPYTVIAAKSGEDALDVLEHTRPDLAILDLMMPGMTGLELCRRIREVHSLVELPVLILTAAIIDADKYQAFRAGANDILQKPYHYSEFMARTRSLIRMKQASVQATNMEVAFLQSQIKPHFLYNVLNSIIALSYDDPERAREMTAHFAKYLRASFDFRNTSEMTMLSNELSLVRSFLAIEKIRFGSRLTVVEDIDPDLDTPVPPLIIQPLIENAVHHGIAKKRAGGVIRLTIKKEDGGKIQVCVADNGPGIPADRIKNILSSAREGGRGVGLTNIDRRLHHFYGTGLQIESRKGEGTIVRMEMTIDTQGAQSEKKELE